MVIHGSRSLTALVLVLVAALAASASAQNSDVEAEALFRDAKALVKKGKIAEACDKFDASERLAHDIDTVMNLADCRERNGQLATSWALFLKVASEARSLNQDALESAARKRAKALDGKLAYVIVAVPAASRVAGLTVTRDGAGIDAALWDSAVPADSGSHVIVASAPGHHDWTSTIEIGNNPGVDSAETVTVPPLEKKPEVVEDKQQPDLVDRSDPERPPPPPPPRSGSGRKKLSLVIAGSGAALALGGGVFAFLAKGKMDDAKAICGGDQMCNTTEERDQAQALSDKAGTFGNVATVLVGVGAGAIVTGVVLYLTAPSGGRGEHALRLDPVISDDGVVVSLSGRLW